MKYGDERQKGWDERQNILIPSIIFDYTSMQFPTFPCTRHPSEEITNFCMDSSCLSELCATCICQHAEIHRRSGSSPRYENIKHTQTRYEQRIRDQLIKIGSDKEWLSLVLLKNEEKTKNVHLTLAKARKDCLDLVNGHFDELEIKVSNEILSENRRNLLHSPYRFEKLNALLMKEFNDLLNISKNLNSPKFLTIVKQLENDILPSSDDFHLKVCKQLKENEVYTTGVIYREELMAELAAHLKKLISMEFILPKVEYVPDVELGRGKENKSQLTQRSSGKMSNRSSFIDDFASKTYLDVPFQQCTRQSYLQEEPLAKSAKLSEVGRMAFSSYCDSSTNFFK